MSDMPPRNWQQKKPREKQKKNANDSKGGFVLGRLPKIFLYLLHPLGCCRCRCRWPHHQSSSPVPHTQNSESL